MQVSADVERFGRYRLLGPLGQGGMGRITLAWDPLLNRRVAIKRLRHDLPAGDPRRGREAEEALLREGRQAQRFRHPGIVPVFDVGRADGEAFLSMDYLEGKTLEQELRVAREEGYVAPYHRSPERTLRVVAEAARALHYVHTHPWPVVHGDLKPENLLVDVEGRPHLLDFGFARGLGCFPEGDVEICGTPSYMAPEQATGRRWEIDVRTDVYGLGAVLYELLVGRAPFTGAALAVLLRVPKERPLDPSEVLERVRVEGDLQREKVRPLPSRLRDLCMSCLEKDRQRRPPSMKDLAEACEQIERDLSVAPRPCRMSAALLPV